MIFLILFSFLIFNINSAFTNEPIEKFVFKDILIKVLLNEVSLNETTSLKISSDNGLIAQTERGKRSTNNSIDIQPGKSNFFINGKKLVDKKIKIKPINGVLKLNNNKYDGIFYIMINNDKLLLINEVELEDYIFSVLFTESWPGWPLEVNKAFAIACRSYVIAKLLENKKNNKNPYHIKNNNYHQTYTGIHKRIELRKAVEETKNVILGHNKKPILAMYDICCGGVIPAHIKNVNFQKAPYLARKKQCTFCKNCKLYSWQAEIDRHDFESVLKDQFPQFGTIRDINIKKDKAGIAQKIEFKDKKSKFILTGKKFYSLYKKTKSFSFSIIKKSDKIIIKGNGYGHHLGICQWGTRELVSQGWDHESILLFYYPHTKFMKLKT